MARAPIGRAMGDIVLVGEHEIGIFAIEQGGNTLSQRSFRVVDVDYENARESAAQRLLAVSAGGHGMRLALSAIWIAFFALLGQARAGSTDSALSAAIDGAWREPQNRARDASCHRHESLTFRGLKPVVTDVEIVRPRPWRPSASGSSPRSKTSSPRIRLARLERALVSPS